MLKGLHVALAYLTVAGFIVRGFWALTGSEMRQQKWVKIVPHVVDTLLLALGVALAIQLSLSNHALHGECGHNLLVAPGLAGCGR